MDITIQDLVVKYGDVVAVEDLTITVPEGEMLVLLGPSGCGKTSTMRAIVGLEEPASGTIRIGDQAVYDSKNHINVPTNKRRIGMVFQSYAIWPHKTVFQNIAFPLRMQNKSSGEIRKRVMETAELLGLENLVDRGASKLSGGQMQRVALARSIAMEPKILLLDEPLSNLDAKLREKLRFDLKELQTELNITSVYVTHDQSEALALADRIAVMDVGHLVQLDEPVKLYKEPKTKFIADFLGVSNIFACTRDGGRSTVTIDGSSISLSVAQSDAPTSSGFVCLRPEAVVIEASSDGSVTGDGVNRWPGRIITRSFLGTHTRYRVASDGGPSIDAVMPAGESEFQRGDRVSLSIAPSDLRVLAS